MEKDQNQNIKKNSFKEEENEVDIEKTTEVSSDENKNEDDQGGENLEIKEN